VGREGDHEAEDASGGIEGRYSLRELRRCLL
jgi:hypothetical protein